MSQLVDEIPDNTHEAIDKEWEEVAVSFSSEEPLCDNNSKAAENFKLAIQTKASLNLEYNSSIAELRALGEIE